MALRDVPLEFARPADARALAEMARDLIEAGLGWAYRPPRVARMIADPDTVALVARDGAAVSGFAVMAFGDERAHLALLAVRPAHRRRGIARSLVGWLVESAAVAGAASVHLELRAGNHAARALYAAAGFTETLRVPGYYGGRETAVRMVRVLRAPGRELPAWRPPPPDRR